MSKDGCIVVGTDFSLSSQTALYFGSVLASAKKVKLHIVYSHTDKRSADIGFDGFHPNRDSIMQMLQSMQPLSSDVEVAHHFLESDAPAKRLADFAAEVNAGLILIGSLGHGANTNDSIGRFAADLMSHAHCPVTISTCDVIAAKEIRDHMTQSIIK